MAAIPGFKPPFPAVELHCNLCNRKVEEGQYVTERIRAIVNQERGGDYLFCKETCAAIAAEVTTRINDFCATVRAAAEREIAEQLPSLVADWIAQRLPEQRAKGEAPDSSPQPQRGRRPPPKGMIPTPKHA